MEPIKKQLVNEKMIRSDEVNRILKCLENFNDDVKAFHKKTNTALVVSIDGKIVHIKPEDL